MPKSRKRRRSNKTGTQGQDKSSGGIHSSWYALGTALAVILAGIVFWISDRGDGAHVNVAVPELAGAAARGESLFGGIAHLVTDKTPRAAIRGRR
jgi:hypothetical protein